jgi:Tfp pilus assembly protein PilE
MPFIERLRREDGMTIIELLVAAVICAVGIAATIGLMDHSRSLSIKSERREAMSHHAQRELERLMELPWLELQHSSQPTTTPTPAGNPSTYISGTSYRYDRKDPAAAETLVWSLANGTVQPSFGTWNDVQARITGRVYRYVTTVDANARRITVIVTADGADVPAPFLVSSIKTKPVL